MKRAGLALGLTVLALLATLSPAEALKISPFKARLILTGTNPTQLFRIENNSTEPAAVQISVLSWTIEPDGREINHDAEDDFVVFPAQLVLQPHESRAVRVQWIGAEPPSMEKPYRVMAEQIPINLKDTSAQGSGVRFLLRFKAALYIAPEEGKSDIKVDRIEGDAKSLRAHIINEGPAHALLRDPVLHLSLTNGQSVILPEDKIGPLSSANIHAGARRFFDIELPDNLPAPVQSARLEFNPGF